MTETAQYSLGFIFYILGVFGVGWYTYGLVINKRGVVPLILSGVFCFIGLYTINSH